MRQGPGGYQDRQNVMAKPLSNLCRGLDQLTSLGDPVWVSFFGIGITES